MTNHPDEGLLVLLLDGELDPAAADEVRSHVGECARCGGHYARLASLTREIGELHHAPAVVRPRRWARWWAPAAATAAAVTLVWLGRPAPMRQPPKPARAFIALPFSDASLPLGDAPIVRMAVPVESLRYASF
jgi:hypothetical protein